MNKKTIFKWLSLFLVTILFINSNTVLLNELSRIMVVNAQENTKEIQEEINPKEVVSEIIEKREKNVKHFKLSDGSYVAAIYPEAVHYKRDGEWVDIDNSLIELIDEHGKKSYTNANNSWEITIKEEAYNRDHVTLQKGEYEISWSMLNQKNTKMTMEIKEKANNKHIDRENIKQKVHFTNILDNVDIEYILHGEYLKENVILHNKPNSDFNYTYIAKLKNLKAELLEDNSILFYDENDVDKKEVFLMEAPFMIDSAGNYSEDIRVHLIETSNGLSITYVPNNDWLTDDERLYPVTIDPTVRTSDSVYAIKDSSVVEGNPTHNYNGTYLDALLLRVGEHSTTKSNESYIKFDLPEFNTGDMVTYAQLNLYLSHDEASSNQVNVHRVLEDWDSFQITWNNRPNYDQTIYDYSNVVGSKYDGFTWDITGIVKEWYNGSPNYGLAIESDPSDNQYSELYGSDTDEYLTPMRPSIAMYYVNNTGLEPHWTYHTQSNGRAGTGYINDYNGNLVFTHSDFAMNGNRMPLSIQHVFNSNNKDSNINLGLGWSTNLNQKIEYATFDGTNYYVYTDEDGTEHYLKFESGTTYKDESGLNISLTVDASNPDGKYVLTDKYENKLIFDDSTLKLIKIKNTKDDQITINYDSSENIVTAIDGVGRVTNFNYSNSLLSSIVTPDNMEISYGYDAYNRLSKITYPDNLSSIYTYDANNNLIRVRNIDGNMLQYDYYTYSPYRVKSVEESYEEYYIPQSIYSGVELASRLEGTDNKDYEYVMFIGSDNTRFTLSGSLDISRSSGFFIGTKYQNGKWYYDNNSSLVEFTPKNEDRIVGVMHHNSTHTGLKDVDMFFSTDKKIHGVDVGGDYTGSINKNISYNGSANDGEVQFTNGTFTHPNGNIYDVSNVTYGGVEIATSLEGSNEDIRYLMYIGTDNSRFTFPSYIDPVKANGHFISTIYRNGQWYYDNNEQLLTFTPNSNDAIVGLIYKNDSTSGITYMDTFIGDNSTINGVEIGGTYTETVGVNKSYKDNYNDGELFFLPGIYRNIEYKEGTKLEIEYGFNTTIFTDYRSRKNVYQFNDWGNTVLIKDYRGRAQYYKYGSNENFNKIETSSRLQETTNNLLIDHSGEYLNPAWKSYNGGSSLATFEITTATSYIGEKSLKIDKTNNVQRSYYDQTLILEKGKTYNFSGYVKTENISNSQNNGAYLAVWYKDKDGNWLYNFTEFINGTNDWDRKYLTFTLPIDSVDNSVIFRAGISYETGVAYFDNLQAEEDTLPNRYNLIDNGDFRYGSTIPDLFNQTGNTDVNDKIVINDNGVDILDNNVYIVNGDAKKSKRLTQNVKVSGLAGDNFVFSSWGKGNSVSLKNDTSTTRLFGVRVTINHKDGSTQEGYVSFNEDTTEWQYISDVIVANEDYDSIDYEIVYENNENIAYFDGLGLFREAFGVTYQYDSDGNVVSSVDVTENNSAFEYDGNNDLIENLSPEGYKYNYEYNDKHQVTKATSSSNIVYSFEYDSNDNPIKTRVEGVSLFIESEYEYDLNGNYLRKYTDSRGNTTEYNYNNISGELDSIIDAKDNRVNYSYDELKRLSGVSNKDSFVNYLYENDRLVQTQTNGVTYSFEYDELGKETKIYVNDILLTENIYQVDNGIETGRLDSVIYGNGNNISYEYDEYNRVTAIITDGIRSYEYTYDNSNQLAEVNDLINSEVVNYEYDLLGRLVKIKKSNGDRVSFIYNQYNKVEQVIEKIDGKYYSTSYTYDRENRISDITYYDLPIVSDSIEFFPLITNTYSLNSIRPIVESKTFEFDNNNKPVYGSYNGSTNLLSNSNFENGLNNWTETSWTGNDDVTGNTIVINEGLNGKSSIMQYDTDGLLDGSNTNTVTYQFITFTSELTTDTEYTLSSYSKRIGNTNPKLGIRCYDANGQTITNAYWNYEKAIPENEWTRIDQTFTLPAGTKKIQVLVRSSVKDRDIVMFDNVQLEKREYTTYYTESNMSSPKNEYDLDINLDSGSFSAWIKPGKNKDYNRQIINNTTTNDSILHLYINTNDELKLAVKKNTTTNWNILSSTEVLNIDEWSFVGFSWKYDNEILKLKLYLNDKIYTKDITDYKDFTGDLTYLGSTYTGGNHLNGQMESVLYSPEQLTDSDFQTLYNKGRSSNVHYTYDELGRVNKVTLVTNDIKKEQHYEYLSGINGSETSLVSGLTTKIFNNLDVQVVNEVFGYEYDKIGNISKITHPDGNTSEFTYDHLNQLLTETHSSTNEKITYDYEGIGNIKKVTTEDISGSIGSTLKEYRYITADGTWSDWIPYTNLTEIEHNINIKDIPNKGKLFNEYELTTEDVNYKIVDGVPSLEFDGISSRASSRNYLEFDGVNDYVSLTNLPVHSTDAVTLSARIYWDGLTQDISTGSDRGTIITLGGSYYLQLMTDGRIAVYTYPDSSASTYDYSNSIIPKHEWVDVTFTEKNGLRKIYINGVLDNTIQRESSIRYQTTSTYIGSENNSIRYFNGKISDASVWNKELTQTEIQNLNSNGLAGNESGLLAHYNFDSMNGTLIDRSVNTNNGAITGATYPGNANLNIKSLFFELTTDNTGGMPVSFDDIEFVWYRGGLDIYNNNYRQRTDTNAPLNQKFKLAIIWNGTNYEFYVDGTKYSSYVYSGTQTLMDISEVTLGYGMYNDNYYFDGSLHDVRFSTMQLSDQQAKDITSGALDVNEVLNDDNTEIIYNFIEFRETDTLANTTHIDEVNYTYSTEWQDQLLSYDGYDITYDSMGNPLTIKKGTQTYYTFEWQGGRQLKKMYVYRGHLGQNDIDITYKYNDSGYRTEKSITDKVTLVTTTTKYTLAGSNVIEEVTGSDKIHYTYDAANKLISMTLNDSTYYYLRNGRGDIVGLVDDNGNKVVSYEYDSWGKLLNITDTSGVDLGNKNPYRYRGYRYDNESSLYYLNSRYYNPDSKRFINADAIIGVTGDILSYNMYAYAKNNPINMADPSGYLSTWKKIGLTVAIVAVVAIGTVATGGLLSAGLIGASMSSTIVGGLFGAGLNMASQVVFEDKGLKEIDYGEVAISGISGAISGRIGAANIHKVGQGISNAVINGTASYIQDRDAKKALAAGVIGGVGGFLGGNGAKYDKIKGGVKYLKVSQYSKDKLIFDFAKKGIWKSNSWSKAFEKTADIAMDLIK